GPLIAGIALLDGLVMLIAGWPAGAALGVAGFALTLAAQRRIAGT
ncbi:MAG: prenyltransferase, partial [Alphaproteobacteria bacterium]|nr:prenyltransferase [Alphaproteobacteria bacterium]